jgi:hypothetical protein
MGVPVTSSGPVGLGDELVDGVGRGGETDANRLRANGETCGRCGRLLSPRQDIRRRPSGDLVHESCPPELSSPIPG